MSADPITTRLEFARTQTMECAKIALQYFETPDADPEHKSDGSPVTIADRTIELELRSRIEDTFPQDTIRGEEFPTKEGSNDFEWIIDPIDGTVSFVQGVPLFGTMLACLHKGTPTIGAIAMPCLDEMVVGALGRGAHRIRPGRPDEPCVMPPRDALKQALVAFTTPSVFLDDERWRMYEQLVRTTRTTRGWSDCYAFVLLVTGRVDAVLESGVNIWDLAPVPPLVHEAGGIWSDMSGKQSIDSGNLIACAKGLHDELLNMTKPLSV